jgi:capsular exopolysaccharide synthesis family protein
MGIDPFIFEDGASQETQKIDLSRYWKALIKRWWVVAITTVVVTVPWVIYVKQEKPIYEATAKIRFKSYGGEDRALMISRIQTLTSRTFAERVIEELGLVMSLKPLKDQQEQIFRKQIFSRFSSTRNPVPGEYFLRFTPEGGFTLCKLDQDSEGETVLYKGGVLDAAVDTVSVNGFSFQLISKLAGFPPEVAFRISSFRNTVKSLQQRIRVDMDDAGTLMELSLSDNDPYVVTQTVNSLANIFVRESIGIRESESAKQLTILEEQLQLAKRELEASDLKIRQIKQRSNLNLDVDLSLKDKLTQRTTVEEELKNLKNMRQALQDLLVQLDKLRPTPTDGTNGQNRLVRRYVFNAIVDHKAFDGNATMALTRQRLQDLDREWNEIVNRTGETHSRAIELQREIEGVYSQIEEMSRSRLATLGNDVTQKQNELAQLKVKLEQIPTEQAELTEALRENNQKAEIYQNVLAQYQKALISTAATTETVNILDPAIEPEYPLNRNKKAKAAAGGAFGVFLGIFIVLVWEILDRTIKTVDDIKSHLKLPVLGAIPHVDFANLYDFQDHEKAKLIDQQLVTHDFSPTPIGEAYRSLRTSIIYSKKTGRIQTLVLTSTAPGDGKSFTAANLSITLAQQKSGTLLVDTDLRRGVQHNTFGVPKEPGFSNYLAGSVLSSEIIHETHIPNLSVISCGSLVPNPSELLGSFQMRRFLDEMRRRFDVIIFDTPPLNAATDAVVLGTQVDGVSIVVRAGKTNREVARQKLELFHNLEAKIIGVILNGTTVDLAHEGYSYYHY